LHLGSFGQSYVNAVQDGHQVGDIGGIHTAAIWSGSAGSAVVLRPASYTNASATGVFGNTQVGYGVPSSGGGEHALLWFGSSTGYVELHPAQATASLALGVYGNEQVGSWRGGATGQQEHAMLWHGSPESAVELHPEGWVFSYAYSTNGVQQVGYGQSAVGQFEHALLWNSTRESFVDLQQFLPANFVGSEARQIDPDGNIIGTAYPAGGGAHAVMWVVPEPSVVSLSLGCFPWAMRRPIRRRQGN
jgi:hypothetical protein